MRFRNRPEWRAPRRTMDQRSPEEIAAALGRALTWRQQWRDEMAAGHAGIGKAIETEAQKLPAQPERPASHQDAKRLAQFAEAIARAEFGRAYWDKHRDGASQGRDRHRGGKSGKR